MKKLILGILVFSSLSIFSQAVKTETFVVKGNCEDCKERIENAADIKGVKVSKWDPDSKVFTVTYRTDKTNLEQIQKAIAAVGYDAGEIKGDDKKYNKLPGCCKYRDRKCENPEKK